MAKRKLTVFGNDGPWYHADGVEKMKKREWICGVGYALAEMQRHFDNSQSVQDVARATGLTYQDFKSAGVAPYDLKMLRKALPRVSKRKPKRRAAKAKARPKVAACEHGTPGCTGTGDKHWCPTSSRAAEVR